MNTTTYELDKVRAEEFFRQADVTNLLEKYDAEIDQELRDDMVKLGNYIKLRESGTKQVWAKMSACRRAAAMNGSDQHFNASERRKMEGHNPIYRERIMQLAKAAGINTSGKFYVGGLGRYTDPAAWVSTIDDVRHVMKVKKMACEGLIDCDYTEDRPLPSPALAPDLAEELVEDQLRHDPGLAERARRKPSVLEAVRKEVVARHGRKKPTST